MTVPCNVTLIKTFSHSPCTHRVSFGCTDGHGHGGRHNSSFATIWVSRGCRGAFSCRSTRTMHGYVRVTELHCGHTGLPQETRANCSCGHALVDGSSRPSVEGHVTLVHGNGIHACAAAINGAVLAAADPRRRRVAMAWNVSSETQRILSHSWTVEVLKKPPAGGARAALKAPVLGVSLLARSTQSKLRRAAYWDADHFVLRTSRLTHAIGRLWDFAPEARVVAVPEAAGCFNSGFFLFWPSLRSQREYEQLVEDTRPHAQPPICDKGRVRADQTYLNAVLSDTMETASRKQRRVDGPSAGKGRGSARAVERYVALDESVWAVRTPMSSNSRANPPCTDSPAKLLTQTHSFHFFDRFAPWAPNCSVDRVLRNGDPCGRNDVLMKEGRVGLEGLQCNGHAAAQALWYSELFRLPTELRSICYRRLRLATT